MMPAPAITASPCFNEAAGIPRGRHQLERLDVTLSVVASMRPRVFPAEDKDVKVGSVYAVKVLQ